MRNSDVLNYQSEETGTSPKDESAAREKYLKKIIILAVVLSLIFGALSGTIFGYMASRINSNNSEGIIDQIKGFVTQNNNDGSQNNGSTEHVNVVEEDSAVISSVEKASPSVVSIVITKDVPKIDDFFSNPFFDDPFFNPFGFNQKQQQQAPSQGETEKKEIGGGTGFIVDQDGYIVTNKHVVQDTDAEYTVIMNDGKKIEAKVLARDPYQDLAILKVDANKLPVVELGDSDSLKIGQTVIAIGNSLGEFRNTVSKGIISGLKRDVNAGDGNGQSELLSEVIQTDAAINPGNSGGPLLNIKGQVVGINVAMAEGAENIGFAVPVNQVKEILQSVKENGRIVTPYLGIRYVVINDQLKSDNNLPVDYGALVVRGENVTDLAVIPGSPADKAGITENDIVLEIDGKKINNDNDLAKIIRQHKVGDTVTLKVWSKGQEKNVQIKLEEANS